MNPSGTNIPGTINSGGTTPGGVSSVPPTPGMVPPTPVNPDDISAQINPGTTSPVPTNSDAVPPAPANTNGMMNSGTTPSTPIASGGGDIVLSSGPEKKSRKGLVVIIVVVAILLIVGGLIAMIFFSNQPKTVKQGTAQSEFNRYANYLINGEDSPEELKENTDESGEEGAPVIYSMVEFDEEGESALYMQQLESLWDGFINVSGNFTLSNGLTNEDYISRLNFLVLYVNNGDEMSENKITEMVFSKNLDEINEAIEKYTNTYRNYEFLEATNFASSLTGLYEQIAEMTNELKEAGCIDSAGEQTCPDESYDEIERKYDLVSYYHDMLNDITSIMDYLVSNAWNINEAIQGSGETAGDKA